MSKTELICLATHVPLPPGHAPEGAEADLEKGTAIHYIFYHETALQNDLYGCVPESPEKRFPITWSRGTHVASKGLCFTNAIYKT